MKMSRLKQNTTQRNGVKIFGSYRVEVNLSTGKEKVTLKGITNKRIALRIKNKVDEIELQSKLFPNENDWIKELYIACGREDLIPNHNDLIPTISEGFKELLSTKQLHKQITKQKTIDAYESAQRLMLKVIGDIPVNQISIMHKAKLELELHSRNYKDNTINIYTRNVMQFLNWCVEVNYLDKLPFKIKQIKVQQNDNVWIQPDEFERIISVMDEVSKSYAIVAYKTGLRKCELNTDPNDKAFNGLYHSIQWVEEDEIWKITVNGKGGKVADIILPNYIKDSYDIMVANRLHPTTISKKFKKACIKVGLPQFYFHHLRHTYSSELAMKTNDAYLIQIAMRHSSLNTTQRYLNDNQLKWNKLRESEVFKA